MKYPILALALALALATLLGGCAALPGIEASALKSIKVTNDNVIDIWVTAACGTPYSAIIRNPRIIPALKALCLPVGIDNPPSSLLDGVAK